MPNSAKPPSPEELEQAFSLFNRASAQLADVYRELEQQVARLNCELAVANGELRRQYDEKEALSRRLSLLLDALPGGVLALDAQGFVIEANAAAIDLLGERVLKRPWSEVQSECLSATASPQEWWCAVQAARRTPATIHVGSAYPQARSIPLAGASCCSRM